jgi:DNA mismatch endonuclease (patch repair protein)
MDKLTPDQRRKNMQAVRASGTKNEVLLAKKLWALGLRYRKNDRRVVGKRDISFLSIENSHVRGW